MKITSFDIYCADYDLKAPNEPIFLLLGTDEGITGYGEAGTAYGAAKNATIGQLKDYANRIIGKDPFATEAIWDELQRDTFWGLGGGVIISAAISAIDIALWDIKGKALGVPVYELLGGKTRSVLRAYASQIQFDWTREGQKPLSGIKEYGDAALRAVDDGYSAIKVDPLQRARDGSRRARNDGLLSTEDIRLASQRLETIRNSVGPDIDIILELHAKTDINGAWQLWKACRDVDIYYLEEPTAPLNPELMAQLHRKVEVPLASGERICTRWGYRPFLEARSLDVIQPDIANCGGISEAKKIADMARVWDVWVQPHVCGGPISMAAAIQIASAIPNFIIQEYHVGNLSPAYRGLAQYDDCEPVHGVIAVPNRCGIGQEIRSEALKRCMHIQC